MRDSDARSLEPVSDGTNRGSPSVVAPVSRNQLEKVIHRAAELQFGQGETPDTLEADEVLRIAEEVGLEGRFVRQALAEVRADALIPARPPDDSAATRLWGEAILIAARVVPGEPHALQARLARYLSERESLRCVRDRPGQLVFEPAKDLMSQIQRGLDFGGRGYALRQGSFDRGHGAVAGRGPFARVDHGGHVQPENRARRRLVRRAWDVSGSASALGAILGGGAPALIVLPAVAAGVGLVGTFGTSRTSGFSVGDSNWPYRGSWIGSNAESRPADRPTLRDRITELLEE